MALSPTPLDDQDQTRLALASLFAALVQTLGEQDEGVPPRFAMNLEALYREVREYPSNANGTMETLRWTLELLRKKS